MALIAYVHAKAKFIICSSRREPRRFVESGSGNPGSPCWDKNVKSSADKRKSAAATNCRGAWFDAPWLELEDAQSK